MADNGTSCAGEKGGDAREEKPNEKEGPSR